MTFEEMLAQVVEVLRREHRVSYRALRRRFGLDEEYLEDLKIESIRAKQLATDEDNTILVWAGDATPTSVSAPERPPLPYTPAHLSEKILTTRTALDRRITAGLALVEQGVEHVVARGRASGLAPAVVCLSEVYLLAGRLEEARQRAAQAIDLARQYQQRGTQARALWLLGESMARQASSEAAPAVGHYCQALALAEELGMRPLQAHCQHGLGTFYARQGQQEQARTALSTAIELYRAIGITFWLPQEEAGLAQVR